MSIIMSDLNTRSTIIEYRTFYQFFSKTFVEFPKFYDCWQAPDAIIHGYALRFEIESEFELSDLKSVDLNFRK